MNEKQKIFIKGSFFGSKEQINQTPISKYEIKDGYIYYMPEGMNDNKFKIIKSDEAEIVDKKYYFWYR